MSLKGTKVSDLRPIRKAVARGAGGKIVGLQFADSFATIKDGEFRRLSQIEYGEVKNRETLAYLDTLPPYPEPYTPAYSGDGSPPQPIGRVPEPSIPKQAVGPLEVEVKDGLLREVKRATTGSETSKLRAQSGWAALRDFLDDLSNLRQQLGNKMPSLAKALGSVDGALGVNFQTMDAIGLGTHGQRVIALAANVEEVLTANSEIVEVREFAAALALYLERFPEWRSYRDDALAQPLDAAKLARILPEIQAIENELFEQVGVDPNIPTTLRNLRELALDAPNDAIAAHGVLDSLGNVLAALGNVLWIGIKATGRGGLGFLRVFGEKAAEKLVDAASSPVFYAALDVFLNKGSIVRAIAVSFPDKLGWLLPLLQFIG